MAEHLFIRLLPDNDDCESIVVDDDGRLLQPLRRGPLAVAAQDAASRKLTVLVPGVDVLTCRVSVPAVSRRRLRQMLPFSMEDALAEDVSGMQFAAGSPLGGGDGLSVAAVSRARLDTWLEQLEACGVEADAVYAESDGVPDTPSTLNLIVDGRRIYGRRPGQLPFVFDGLGLIGVYELLVAQSETDEAPDLRRVYVYLADAESPGIEADIESLRPRLASLEVKALADGVLPRLAAYLASNPGTNLLQGDYGRKTDWPALAKPWATAAALLLAVLAATILVRAGEFWVLRRQDSDLTELLTSSCSSRYSLARLSSCAAEVRRRLNEAGAVPSSGGSRGFLTTLAAVAEHKQSDYLVEALSYRNEVMDLRMVLPSVADLDRFSQRLVATERFDVRVESTTPGDDGVESHLQIVEVAP